MSYTSQGVAGVVIGVFLLILPPVGIVTIVLSILLISKGSKPIIPGTQPGWCKWNGHDWRSDLQGIPPGSTCRNCLKRKDGRSLVGLSPMGPWTFGTPGWTPGPGYGGYPMVVPPVTYAAPAPYAAPPPAPPPQQVYCASCGLSTDASQPVCAHCGRPSR